MDSRMLALSNMKMASESHASPSVSYAWGWAKKPPITSLWKQSRGSWRSKKCWLGSWLKACRSTQPIALAIPSAITTGLNTCWIQRSERSDTKEIQEQSNWTWLSAAVPGTSWSAIRQRLACQRHESSRHWSWTTSSLLKSNAKGRESIGTSGSNGLRLIQQLGLHLQRRR